MCHNTTAQLEKRTICFIILTIVVAMKVISVSITLCAVLTLSRALPLNSTLQTGSCDYAKQNCSSARGAFCPRCDSDGNYLPLQCSGSSGYCWCVNVTSGQEIPNTQTPPGVAPACGLCKIEQLNCSKSVPGAFCPKCDADGNFLPEQCSGSTGYCWCVDVLSGKTLTNSKVPPGNQTTCGLCKNEQLNCSKSVPGAFCPKCDANGNFLPEQCSGSTGYCWCVDVFTGKVETNTMMPPGNRTIICVSGVVGNTSLLPEPKPGCVNCGNSSNSSEEENKSEESDSECDDCSDSSDSSEEEKKSEESDSECDDCSDSSNSSEEENKSEESDSECDDCSSESDACPTGWSRFRDQCYVFVNTPKTWIEAEIYCQFDEANLASVHCDKGNRFIMSLTRGDTHDFPQTWLGGFDAIRSGYWMWSDGSDFDYNNWSENLEDDSDEHKNHDDNGKKKKNCLRMNYEYDLKWFYSSCSETLPFVCAKSVSKNHNK